MGGDAEGQWTTSSVKPTAVKADDERSADSNTGWQAFANCSPNWTLRIAPLVSDHLIGSLVCPRALT